MNLVLGSQRLPTPRLPARIKLVRRIIPITMVIVIVVRIVVIVLVARLRNTSINPYQADNSASSRPVPAANRGLRGRAWHRCWGVAPGA